jgi:hypothetical protein
LPCLHRHGNLPYGVQNIQYSREAKATETEWISQERKCKPVYFVLRRVNCHACTVFNLFILRYLRTPYTYVGNHDTSGWGSCNVRSMEEKNKSLMSLKVTYMPRRFPSGRRVNCHACTVFNLFILRYLRTPYTYVGKHGTTGPGDSLPVVPCLPT